MIKLISLAIATVSGSIMTQGYWLPGILGLGLAMVFTLAEENKLNRESE